MSLLGGRLERAVTQQQESRRARTLGEQGARTETAGVGAEKRGSGEEDSRGAAVPGTSPPTASSNQKTANHTSTGTGRSGKGSRRMVGRLSVAERKVSMTMHGSVLDERIEGAFSFAPTPELIVASLRIAADMPLERYCLGGAALAACQEVMDSDLVGLEVKTNGSHLPSQLSSVREAVGVALLLDEASQSSRARAKTLANLRDQLIRALLAPVERYVERHRRGWDRRQEGSAGSRARRAFCYDVSILTTQRRGPRPTPREAYALLCALAFADDAHIREAIATLGGLDGRDALEAQARY